jgi:hypothetical protein
LRTMVLCVVSFRASDTKMRRHSSQSRMMSLARIFLTGLMIASP